MPVRDVTELAEANPSERKVRGIAVRCFPYTGHGGDITVITRLRIEGYKSLGQVELADLGKLVVLFGPNASGKSNLLDAIDLLRYIVRDDTAADALRRHRGNRLDRQLPVRWHFHGGNEERPSYRMAFEVDLSLQARIVSEINETLAARERIEALQRPYTRVTHTRLRYRVVLHYDAGNRVTPGRGGVARAPHPRREGEGVEVLERLRGGGRFRVEQRASGSRFRRTDDLPLLRRAEERESLENARCQTALVARGDLE